jgi:uncharacterized membrane protein
VAPARFVADSEISPNKRAIDKPLAMLAVLPLTRRVEAVEKPLSEKTVTTSTHARLNQELVKQGWCWWYRKYALGDTVLEGLEKEARKAKKGLWADPQPVPPWEGRKSSH